MTEPITWKEDPGCAIQAPLTYGGDYVFSHRYEGLERSPVFCGSYRPKGEHHSMRWFTSIDQAKEAAERHQAGVRCSCGLWDRFHKDDCPLISPLASAV